MAQMPSVNANSLAKGAKLKLTVEFASDILNVSLYLKKEL
jgi:hypothetical protein